LNNSRIKTDTENVVT